jgi:hypothetical protein
MLIPAISHFATRSWSSSRVGGHTNEVIDLYAMRFNPVFASRDFPNWIDENVPLETLKRMILENSGGSIQQFILDRWTMFTSIQSVR